jgi:hypothetical protein
MIDSLEEIVNLVFFVALAVLSEITLAILVFA